MEIKLAAEEFLANRRIAVTGVSRHPKGHGAIRSTSGSTSAATRWSQ